MRPTNNNIHPSFHVSLQLLWSLPIIVFLQNTGFCQVPVLTFRTINREQGLSNSIILSIYQDRQGFMWFGTDGGLNRYDGYKTIVYQNNPTDSGSISGNYISSLLEDSKGNLWVGTGTGLNQFDRNRNVFIHFLSKPGNAATLNGNGISCIFEDSAHNIWVGTQGGLNLLDKTGHGFIRIVNPQKNSYVNRITCLYQHQQGSLLVGTDGGGLFVYDKQTGKFTPVAIQKDAENTAAGYITAITIGPNKQWFIGTKGTGLIVLDSAGHHPVPYRHQDAVPASLSSNVIKSLFAGKNGVVWIGTENGGLNRWQASSGQSFIHYENNPDNPHSLSQKTASAILEDNTGNLWVGTHRGGVSLYSPSANKFSTYTQGRGALSYKDVKTFFEDSRGKIWIGTDGGGINLWDPVTGIFSNPYRHQPTDPASIGSNAILHIMQDREGHIWVGTWGGGLNLYTGNGSFKKYLHNPADAYSISSDNVWRIFEDSRGNLWVATFYGGLNLFDRKAQRFTRITGDSLKQTPFLGNNVVSINEDRTGNLWFGTDDGGLNCFDITTGRFEHYFNQGKDGVSGNIGNARVIFTDSKKRLWVGKKGLYLFDEDKKTFISYTDNTLLANENIQGITEDKKGILWISSRNGLMAFDPVTKKIKQYDNTDGLQGLEFNQNACLTLSGGRMLFGGFNGFNLFNPLNMPVDNPAELVYITDFQVFNKSMQYGRQGSPLTSPVDLTRELTLNYNQSVFSFEYTAIDYASPGEARYAYKLDGFDHDWNYVGTQQKATFTNLDPGTYTFHVKAGTPNGVWSSKSASIRVIVKPPYWMTWWFRLLALLLILSIGYTVFFYRRKFELKKLDEQKAREMHQVQLQFFTNISHELRTPLSLIAGPLEKMKQEDILPAHRQYYQMMQRNVNRLMALICELMDFRKVEEGALKLKVLPGDFGLFVHEIADDFFDMALQKNIHFTVKIPESLQEVWFDYHIVEKIIINLVHNAFKYTADGGSIVIEVLTSLQNFTPRYKNELLVKSDFQSNRQIYIRITDTGRGISKESIRYLFERYYRTTQEHLGSGVGLAFVKSLTLLHKGAIHVYSQLDEGTEIIIALPATKEDYSKAERWTSNDQDGNVQLESIRYKSAYHDPPVHVPVKQTETHLRKHLLIVDDNEELRSFLKESLGAIYHVSDAVNGSQGLQKAKDEMPDLVISDVMMPVMDGIEFCRRLKEDIETSHIPFILLTARDALETRMDGADSRADYYFSKPVSMELLTLTIRNLFEQRQKIKERYSHDYKVEVKELVHTAKDKAFMDSLLALVEQQLENTELNVEYICMNIGMSKTKLYKKIKDITGQTINEFVRKVRLKKAAEIMTHEDVTVTEVMYRIGIQSNSYFTTVFKKEFGKTPSQFMQEMEIRRSNHKA